MPPGETDPRSRIVEGSAEITRPGAAQRAGFVKSRLGKDYDGGYVIVHRPGMQYSALLSGGISDDISFELDFVREYGCPCDAFDGTIWSLPSTPDGEDGHRGDRDSVGL